MDFFDRQEKTRKRTGVLLVSFFAAILLTASMVYLVLMLAGFFLKQSSTTSGVSDEFVWWYPTLFLATFLTSLAVIGVGSLVKMLDLRRGGSVVAERLGGRLVAPNSDDFFERRLLNVVEEMAIASGMSVPPVYVLRSEKSINAFAAGYSTRDAVVAVTRGTMTGLTRDELQGVIAHEFSHILNGDMRLNIHLMGSLHGLFMIALIGRSFFHVRARGKGAAYIYLVGGALFAIGSIGLFFGKLIKSAISRQREFLADAAAVQFTRNPTGLSGALKKIGGLSRGSRLSTARAEEASHMFFGAGVRKSIFSTHPSLKERVLWLEPGFDGIFEKVSLDSLHQALVAQEGAPALKKKKRNSVVDHLTRPVDLAMTGTVLQGGPVKPMGTTKPQIKNPEEFMATIGAPLKEHMQSAEALIERIPAAIREAGRDPYGARAVFYFLLLDTDDEIRRKQLVALRNAADSEEMEELDKMISLRGQLTPELRLPVLDLAMPALRQLSQSQYVPFRENLRLLVDADDHVSLFEYVLLRILRCHIDPIFDEKSRRNPSASYYAFCGVQRAVSCLLSALAGMSASVPDAFQHAVEKIPDQRAVFMLLPVEECRWEQLDAALDQIDRSSFYIKKWVLAAALACLMHDREITVEEVELFRAIADSLSCPVPPWLAVMTLEEEGK